jgi:hypothetical protein
MSTATIDTTLLTYAELNSGKAGAYCTFVKIGSRGLKCYKCRDQRDKHYRFQSELSEAYLAPATFGTTDCVLPDGSVRFAYWTDCVEVAEDRHCTDWIEMTDCKAYAELIDDLEEYGYPWNDDHTGNFGYVKNDDGTERAVIIDTGGY